MSHGPASFLGVSRLYIRESYRKLHHLIHDTFAEEHILLTGNPGIGKSMFCFYQLYRLLTCLGAGAAIVFESAVFDEVCALTVDTPPAGQLATAVISCDPDVIAAELHRKTTIYLFDAGTRALKTPRVRRAARTMVFSSPDHANYIDYAKHNTPKILYMPVWERCELEKIKGDGHFPEQKFDLWGGIPRYVFSEDSVSRVELETAIHTLPLDELIGLGHGSSDGGDISHKIIHQVTNDDYDAKIL